MTVTFTLTLILAPNLSILALTLSLLGQDPNEGRLEAEKKDLEAALIQVP